MHTNPPISTIVPVYNGEKFVRPCMENLLRQSYKDLEIIVVDDGSRDQSVEVARSFPVKVIEHGKNRGVSAARNTGIKVSTGKYIHFMDVDDEINTEFFEKMVEAIESTGSDIAVACMYNEDKFRRSVVFNKQMILSSTEDKLRTTDVGKRGYVWRYLFRKSFLFGRDLKFEEGRLIEDLPFSLAAVFFANQLVTVPGAKYFYKCNEGSIMKNGNEAHRKKRDRDGLYAKKLRYEFAKEHKIKIPKIPSGILGYYFVKWFT